MNRLLALLLAGAGLAAATFFLHHAPAAPSAPPPAKAGTVLTGRIVAITDGDTLTLLTQAKGARTPVKLRLAGIDAPEARQPFGSAAKQRLSDLAYNKNVRAEVSGADRYGRQLAVLHVGKLNVNAEMVASGYAWHFLRFSSDATLAALEKAARKSRRGLWADPAPVAPWDWREAK